MGYLITAVKAMQEYGIREQQIRDIMNFSGITIYGPSGKKLKRDEFSRYYAMEYETIYRKVFKNDFNTFGLTQAQREERDELLDAIDEKAREQVVRKYLSFNFNEFKAAIEKIYPDIVIPKATIEPGDVSERDAKTSLAPSPQSSTEPGAASAPDALEDEKARAAIADWEAAASKLKGDEHIAAMLAIQKWKGMSHAEAFEVVMPKHDKKHAKSFVSKRSSVAESIANRYHLSMPDWETKSKKRKFKQSILPRSVA